MPAKTFNVCVKQNIGKISKDFSSLEGDEKNILFLTQFQKTCFIFVWPHK